MNYLSWLDIRNHSTAVNFSFANGNLFPEYVSASCQDRTVPDALAFCCGISPICRDRCGTHQASCGVSCETIYRLLDTRDVGNERTSGKLGALRHASSESAVTMATRKVVDLLNNRRNCANLGAEFTQKKQRRSLRSPPLQSAQHALLSFPKNPAFWTERCAANSQ